MNDVTTLRIAIGDYSHNLLLMRGDITSPSLKLDFVDVKPMHMAFKPMVRAHAYDAREMALVTYLQAKICPPGAGEVDTAPFGKAANRSCLELLISHAVQQGLISRRLARDELVIPW